MFKIHNLLAISNGEPVYNVRLTGTYANGTKYYIVDLNYGSRLVIETDKIICADDHQTILKAIDDGKLDIWPLNTYYNGKGVEDLRKSILEKIEKEERIKRFTVGLQALKQKYPKVDEEFINQLKSHDWYYDYSDDIGVWRAGKEQKDKLISKLRLLDSEGLYGDYYKLLTSK